MCSSLQTSLFTSIDSHIELEIRAIFKEWVAFGSSFPLSSLLIEYKLEYNFRELILRLESLLATLKPNIFSIGSQYFKLNDLFRIPTDINHWDRNYSLQNVAQNECKVCRRRQTWRPFAISANIPIANYIQSIFGLFARIAIVSTDPSFARSTSDDTLCAQSLFHCLVCL